MKIHAMMFTLFVLCLCAVSALAQAPGYSGPGRYRIETVAAGKALDVSTGDGRSVQQWAASGAANQQWEVEDAGNGFVTLRSVEYNKLLDFAENRNRDGVAIIVADKRNSETQLWKIADEGNNQSAIISKTGKSIEVPASARRADGTKLQTASAHGLENQRFVFYRLGDVPLAVGRPREREMPGRIPPSGGSPAPTTAAKPFSGPGRYTLQFVHSGQQMDLRTSDQETVQQWSGSGGRNQQWDVVDAGGGYYFILSAENGKALTVEDRRGAEGSPIKVQVQRSADEQKWRIIESRAGEYTLVSRYGRVLDLYGFAMAEGAPVLLSRETRADNQRVRFVRADQQAETYVQGARRRGDAPPQAAPPPAPAPVVEAPYTPGSLVWRGRVDMEILLDVRGGQVTERHVTGNPFNNGRILKSSGTMPLRPLSVRVRNIKVRGSVEIVEQPSAANHFTAVLRVKDPARDAADYEFELSW